MKVLSPNTFRCPVYRIFAHLSDEERIDQACELLAEGVLRLAAKRGLLKQQLDPGNRIPAKAKETT